MDMDLSNFESLMLENAAFQGSKVTVTNYYTLGT
jgi:hypothetical protein